MATGVGYVIDAPPLTPPVNGLINSAQVIEQIDERFVNGIEFGPEGCGGVQVFNPCDTTPEFQERLRSAKLALDPFGVYAEDQCSSFGFQKNDYEGRARRLLIARESAAVEKEFWSGALFPTNPHLASGDEVTDVTGGDALDVVSALSALIQGIADNGLGRGMIHARPSLVNRWASRNMVYREGGKLYTYTGSIVVPGSGYLGTGPDAEAVTSSSEWAYATELVQVQRGPVILPANLTESLTRVNNKVLISAQRIYSVVFNACAIVGVNVNPTASEGGSSNVF